MKVGFALLIVLSCGYAIWSGGRPARLACIMMVGTAVMTQFVTLDHQARWPLLTVDTALFAGLVWISLTSDRFWPIWIAGLHGAGVASHVAVLLSDDIDFHLYQALIGYWSIPVLLVMPLGIMLDRRSTSHVEPERL